jgi:hypothetical protein
MLDLKGSAEALLDRTIHVRLLTASAENRHDTSPNGIGIEVQVKPGMQPLGNAGSHIKNIRAINIRLISTKRALSTTGGESLAILVFGRSDR